MFFRNRETPTIPYLEDYQVIYWAPVLQSGAPDGRVFVYSSYENARLAMQGFPMQSISQIVVPTSELRPSENEWCLEWDNSHYKHFQTIQKTLIADESVTRNASYVDITENNVLQLFSALRENLQIVHHENPLYFLFSQYGRDDISADDRLILRCLLESLNNNWSNAYRASFFEAIKQSEAEKLYGDVLHIASDYCGVTRLSR